MIELDRDKFFPAVRAELFKGRLTEKQFQGLDYLLEAADPEIDRRSLAYVLATAQHETAHTMQPIGEYGKGRGRTYGATDPETGHAYYGRGYVQITWRENYRKMGELLGVDLVHNPELALEPSIAARILFLGMELGSFTGRKLADYFNATKTDWLNARRIVNGMDCAELIAGHARKYHAALTDKGN